MGRRDAFDPLQGYVANRTFAYGARTYVEGDPFEDRTDMRRLRQLYDSRYLRMAPKRTDMPNFKGMDENQLKDWLIAKGFPTLAHPRSPHMRLVERAQRVWAELAAAQLGPRENGKAHSNGATAPPQRERLPRQTAQPSTERVRL